MVWYMQDAFCWRTKLLLLDFRHDDHCIRPHCRDIFLVWGPARLASIDIPVAVLLLRSVIVALTDNLMRAAALLECNTQCYSVHR
jgi:hypothetical protein